MLSYYPEEEASLKKMYDSSNCKLNHHNFQENVLTDKRQIIYWSAIE